MGWRKVADYKYSRQVYVGTPDEEGGCLPIIGGAIIWIIIIVAVAKGCDAVNAFETPPQASQTWETQE